jgi:hypothetical protein
MVQGTVTVECLSSQTYADRPISLTWEGERLLIEMIEARWRIPGGRRFRVRTQDDRIFQLDYAEQADEWEITLN